MNVFAWVSEYLPEDMSLAVCRSVFVGVSSCLSTGCLCMYVFCPPTIDWSERCWRGPAVYLLTSFWLSAVFLCSNKATLRLPPNREPRMMKLCARPDREASFTPVWSLQFLLTLTLAALSCSLTPNRRRLTLCHRLSHSPPASYLSIQPSDFTTPFVVINQSLAPRERDGGAR